MVKNFLAYKGPNCFHAALAFHGENLTQSQFVNVKREEVIEMETRMSGGDVMLDPGPSDDGEDSFGPIAYLADAAHDDAVFAEPTHPYTKGLAAAFPTIGGMSSRMAPGGLGGDPPTPSDLPPGCPFHPRCPVARPECQDEEPELRISGPDQRAACILV